MQLWRLETFLYLPRHGGKLFKLKFNTARIIKMLILAWHRRLWKVGCVEINKKHIYNYFLLKSLHMCVYVECVRWKHESKSYFPSVFCFHFFMLNLVGMHDFLFAQFVVLHFALQHWLSFNINNKICNKNLPLIARYVVIFLYNADKDSLVYSEIKVKFKEFTPPHLDDTLHSYTPSWLSRNICIKFIWKECESSVQVVKWSKYVLVGRMP